MTATNCLFCRIAAGAIPAKVVYEDNLVVAFEDINPQAPTHVLVIPREHIAMLSDTLPENELLLGHMTGVATQIAKQCGADGGGYRLVFNCGADAGQTVFHIHLHLLFGRKFAWPPG